MKYALLAVFVCAVGFVACSNDKSVVNSSPQSTSAAAAKMTVSGNKAGGGGSPSGLVTQGVRELVSTGTNTTGLTVSAGTAGGYRGINQRAVKSAGPPPYTMLVTSDDEQRLIEENLALITAFYKEDKPDHFLILVGDAENLIDDMSCNSHDQAVVDRMLGGGNPRFLHLAATEDLSAANAAEVDEEGRPMNLKYIEAPQHIKDAIDYVNQFAGHEGAVSDDSTFVINYSSDDGSIYNGKCQDLGIHHLGLFKDTIVVDEMNNAGYGNSTWNGLPVYGSTLLVDVTIGGINWKLKLDTDNGKFFIRKNSSTNYCKDWVYDSSSLKDFLLCSVVYIASSYISNSF